MTASSARKLFGTDGIRAVAGQAPLDPTTIYSVGLALAHSLRKTGAPTHRSSSVGGKTVAEPRVLLGRDTRESGPWIAATLAAGLREAGAQVESAGIVTTPAVAFLARTHGFHAGVVISASHNPWDDNGIKLFGADGFKLADAVELAMEDEIFHHAAQVDVSDPHRFPAVEDNPALQADYIQFLIDCVPGLSLSHLKIVADCANGAAAAIAPELFHRLDREGRDNITLLNIAPDGRNINDNCGALHPDARRARGDGPRRRSRPNLRRRRRPLHVGRPQRQRDQRRRHPAHGRARPEGPRHVDRRSGRRHHHVQHGP